MPSRQYSGWGMKMEIRVLSKDNMWTARHWVIDYGMAEIIEQREG